MSRVIETLGQKRKCTNYRDGFSWRSIGGGDWLVHGPTPTSGVSGVCVSVCFLMQRDWMHQRRMDISLGGESPASQRWYDVQGICPSGLFRV